MFSWNITAGSLGRKSRFLMFKNIRKNRSNWERGRGEEEPVIKKNLYFKNPVYVLKLYHHKSMHYLISLCLPCSLISHPARIWFRYSHPGWHLPTSHFCFTTSLWLSCVPLWGTASFLQKLFLKQKRETFRFCQKAFSSWRRSSRRNSQMMTAIVKGQISPCGFASDCMFISFWSGRDSKPLSRSPHSPNSWSSACHWNRLIADPRDRGKVAVCHPTSVLAKQTSSAVGFFFDFTMWQSDQLFSMDCSLVHQMIKTHCKSYFMLKIQQ